MMASSPRARIRETNQKSCMHECSGWVQYGRLREFDNEALVLQNVFEISCEAHKILDFEHTTSLPS